MTSDRSEELALVVRGATRARGTERGRSAWQEPSTVSGLGAPAGTGEPRGATAPSIGVVESVHRGHLVVLDGKRVVLRRGDPDATILPRSTLKPMQAAAMLRTGLDLDGPLLALAASSHSGEPAHREGVLRILATAGLAPEDLQNTPGLPLDADGELAWRASGDPPSSLAQNCSGKHAAMLATCVAAGWDTAGYRDPDHPLQHTIRAHVQALTGDEVAHVAVDGCGAPLFSCTVAGLARAFASIATAPAGSAEGRVAAAIRAHPWWLGGTGRLVTRLVEAVPGLVVKDGAEAVFAGALPDGRAFAFKIRDGSPRAFPVLAAAALRELGVDVGSLGRVDVLGHGMPVGSIVPAWSDGRWSTSATRGLSGS